jgi:aminodeoxyfutalosine deaminase
MARMGPLAELHLHLEGSLEPETLQEIDPALTREEITHATSYRDFEGFIQSYIWVNRRLQTPAHYAIAARRLFERLGSQGVTYAEITLSAGMMLWKGQDFAAIYNAVHEEAARAPMKIFWILDSVRQFGAEAARPVFDLAAERANDGVVAVGLGGFEAGAPALDFAELFARARDRGLHTVCHAGETTNAQNVWDAIAIGAERIGHGIRSIEDPKLMDHLREKQIPLEICITSNLRTGAIASLDQHPVRKLFDAGVPVTIHTDDPALFDCTLASEYRLAQDHFGLPVEQLARNSFHFSFAAQR